MTTELSVIEIHPYDLCEYLSTTETITKIKAEKFKFQDLGNNFFAIEEKVYHRNPNTPRTDGPHSIF